MWPDCSPPRTPPSLAQRLEHVAVADVGRRPRGCRARPAAVEPEVRHHRHGHEVDARGASARIARIWSPSTTSPRSSTASIRSPSPSNATPRSSPSLVTVLLQRARSVAPQPDVDVRPVGLDADRASPRRRAARTPSARSRCTRRSRSRRRSAARRGRSRSARARARGSCPSRHRRRSISPPPGASASRSASIFSSLASVSFCPSRSKNLTPLYSGGLCDAEMTAPRSSASSATAGVGSTPASTAVPAGRSDPARERLLELEAGGSRVAADEDAAAAGPQRDGLAEPLDELRGQVARRRSRGRRRCRSTRAPRRVRALALGELQAPCAPCADRPSCARRCARRASGSLRASAARAAPGRPRRAHGRCRAARRRPVRSARRRARARGCRSGLRAPRPSAARARSAGAPGAGSTGRSSGR